MCTLSYRPKSGQGFVFTSSRDEQKVRPSALLPEWRAYEGEEIFFPKDAKAGGTWIGVKRNGFTACLLNGAFEKHEHKPPYRKSRGLILLEYLKAESPFDFHFEEDLLGIEPFLLVSVNPKLRMLTEHRWNGKKKYVKILAFNKPVVWSSATLYDAEQRQTREKWFEEWLSEYPEASLESSLLMHKKGNSQIPETAFFMQREKVQTVSLTGFEFFGTHFEAFYKDTRSQEEKKYSSEALVIEK